MAQDAGYDVDSVVKGLQDASASTKVGEVTEGIKAIEGLIVSFQGNKDDLTSGDPASVVHGITSVAAAVAGSAGVIAEMLAVIGVAGAAASPLLGLLGPIGAGLGLLAAFLGMFMDKSDKSANEVLNAKIVEISEFYSHKEEFAQLRVAIGDADYAISQIEALSGSELSKEVQISRIQQLCDDLQETLGATLTKLASYATTCAGAVEEGEAEKGYFTLEEGEAEKGYLCITLLPVLHLKLSLGLLLLESNQYFADSVMAGPVKTIRDQADYDLKKGVEILTKPLEVPSGGKIAPLYDLVKVPKGQLEILKHYFCAPKASIAATQKHAKMCHLTLRGSVITMKSQKHGNFIAHEDGYAVMTRTSGDYGASGPTEPSHIVVFPKDNTKAFLDPAARDTDQEVYIYGPETGQWMQNNHKGWFYGDVSTLKDGSSTEKQYRFNFRLRNNGWELRWNFDGYNQYLQDSLTLKPVEQRNLYFDEIDGDSEKPKWNYDWELDFQN